MESIESLSDKQVAGLKKLREPFPEHQISKLPKGTKAQNECPNDQKKNCQICGGWHHPQIKHLDYVGHAALTDRLLDADPEWYWEPLAFDEQGLPRFDPTGGLWIKLTVCGITRLGYGNAENKTFMDVGARIKEVIGDCLRNAGMRFGCALDLWHKGDLHKDEEEQKTTTMITPDPVDNDKVLRAAVWLKDIINADNIEENYQSVKSGYARLSNNERMALDDMLKDKATGSNRSYRNILRIYLDHKPEPSQAAELAKAKEMLG